MSRHTARLGLGLLLLLIMAGCGIAQGSTEGPVELEFFQFKPEAVGTFDRIIADYAAAVDRHEPALVVKVHQSNYRMVGFTESVGVDELAGLGGALEALGEPENSSRRAARGGVLGGASRR